MFDVAIVGSGPAGLAATIFAVRKGVDCRLIAGTFGGKTSLSVNFPDMDDYVVLKAKEQVHVYRAQIEYLSHIWVQDVVDRIVDNGDHFLVHLGGGEPIKAQFLIVATGARPELLNVPGEARYFGKALGSSAISYSHMLRDRDVCILGNSDRAIEAAVECSAQAARIHLVMEPHAKYSHETLARAGEREEIAVLNGYSVASFEGDDWAREVVVYRGDSRDPSARERKIPADAFFVERESRPNSELVADLVRLDDRGSIIVDRDARTSHPRVFAAGDVTSSGSEQILIALGDGTRASLAVYRELTYGPSF